MLTCLKRNPRRYHQSSTRTRTRTSTSTGATNDRYWCGNTNASPQSRNVSLLAPIDNGARTGYRYYRYQYHLRHWSVDANRCIRGLAATNTNAGISMTPGYKCRCRWRLPLPASTVCVTGGAKQCCGYCPRGTHTGIPPPSSIPVTLVAPAPVGIREHLHLY